MRFLVFLNSVGILDRPFISRNSCPSILGNFLKIFSLYFFLIFFSYFFIFLISNISFLFSDYTFLKKHPVFA